MMTKEGATVPLHLMATVVAVAATVVDVATLGVAMAAMASVLPSNKDYFVNIVGSWDILW